MEVKNLINYCKKNNLQLFRTTLYLVMKTANTLEELRLRIRGKKVYLHDSVSSGITILGENGLYGNCIIEHKPDFNDFLSEADKRIKAALNSIELDINKENRDDLIYVTCVKWLSFTSVEHPIRLRTNDSIPRIAWGKYFNQGKLIKMPLSLMVHHSLLDGYQASHFFNSLQESFNNPKKSLYE